MKPRLVMLHGFTGSGSVFDHLRDGLRIVVDLETPDLAWHWISGGHAGPPLSAPSGGPMCPPLILHGYSLGGRIAMRQALANPAGVQALILESTHPGIESEVEREERRQRDATLAASIRENYPRFLAAWNRLPLFASPSQAPSAPRKHFEAIQRSHPPELMARSLEEYGAGTMLPVRDRLHTFPMPVLAITGALDHAYTDLWAGIARETPHIRHVIVPDAGHRVHLDNPESYLSILTSFIQDHFPS